MNLLPHQQVSHQFLLDRKRVILADEPRVGKTLPTALAVTNHLPALIVCPAIVKTVWKEAIERTGYQGEITVINGRKMAENFEASGIVIINYDLLNNIKKIGKFQTLVLDESHRIKSNTSLRTKAALKLMKMIPRVYALSGTPIPNRPIELYPLLSGLGIYRGSYYDFALRYAKMWQAPWGLDVSGASNLPELKAMIQPHMIRRTKEEVFTNYQDPIVSLITFDLPIDKKELAFNADNIVDHPNPLLAIEGLSLVMKEAGLRKVQQACEFISEKLQHEPVVVFAHHKEVVKQIEDILGFHTPSVITGDTPSSIRSALIENFQKGITRLFIGNLSACQEGIDLSVADTVIFVEATWQTSALEQASSRVENINKQGKAPLIYLLTIANSLDHVILKKVLKKQNIINQII
jgi:SWI/SNF-related matrix-associated actin-dependent regulator 1 of chromatin subfamily A